MAVEGHPAAKRCLRLFGMVVAVVNVVIMNEADLTKELHSLLCSKLVSFLGLV